MQKLALGLILVTGFHYCGLAQEKYCTRSYCCYTDFKIVTARSLPCDEFIRLSRHKKRITVRDSFLLRRALKNILSNQEVFMGNVDTRGFVTLGSDTFCLSSSSIGYKDKVYDNTAEIKNIFIAAYKKGKTIRKWS